MAKIEKRPLDPNIENPKGGRRKAAPLRLRRELSLAERIQRMVRSESFAAAREREGEETFDEADDFDVGEDYDPNSPYEEMFYGEFDYHREQRIEARREETNKRRKKKKPQQEKPKPDISDGADPSSKAGSASKGISDGETPTSR